MNAFTTALSPIRRSGRSALELHWRNFGFRPYPAAPVRLINFVAASDCPQCGLVGQLECRTSARWALRIARGRRSADAPNATS